MQTHGPDTTGSCPVNISASVQEVGRVERDRDRKTEKETEMVTDGDRERDGERQRQTETATKTGRDRDKDRQRGDKKREERKGGMEREQILLIGSGLV